MVIFAEKFWDIEMKIIVTISFIIWRCCDWLSEVTLRGCGKQYSVGAWGKDKRTFDCSIM